MDKKIPFFLLQALAQSRVFASVTTNVYILPAMSLLKQSLEKCHPRTLKRLWKVSQEMGENLYTCAKKTYYDENFWPVLIAKSQGYSI